MNIVKRYILPFIANQIQTPSLQYFAQTQIIHPFYHTIAENYIPHINPLYTPKSFKEFQNDIFYLNLHFHPIDIKEVYLYSKGEKLLKKSAFHLSFDDGLREVYIHALPFLYQNGIPATIFINSDFIDNKKLFFRHKASIIIDTLNKKKISQNTKKEINQLLNHKKISICSQILSVKYTQTYLLDKIALLLEIDFENYLKTQQPYLTTEELLSMQKKGFSIGSHSIDHPPFSELSKDEQIRQLKSSISYIDETFKEPLHYFAFPFSDEGIQEIIFRSMDQMVDISFGIGGIGTHYKGKHIARIDMEKAGKNAKEAINKAYIKYLLKEKIKV